MSCSMSQMPTLKRSQDEMPDQFCKLDFFVRIHACGGFVEQKNFRIGRQGPGNLQPPLLAVGQAPRRIVCPVGKAECFEDLHSPARFAGIPRR